jgi:hypothetical protein
MLDGSQHDSKNPTTGTKLVVGVIDGVGVGVGGGQLLSTQALDIMILTNSAFELGSLPQT